MTYDDIRDPEKFLQHLRDVHGVEIKLTIWDSSSHQFSSDASVELFNAARDTHRYQHEVGRWQHYHTAEELLYNESEDV